MENNRIAVCKNETVFEQYINNDVDILGRPESSFRVRLISFCLSKDTTRSLVNRDITNYPL